MGENKLTPLIKMLIAMGLISLFIGFIIYSVNRIPIYEGDVK